MVDRARQISADIPADVPLGSQLYYERFRSRFIQPEDLRVLVDLSNSLNPDCWLPNRLGAHARAEGQE